MQSKDFHILHGQDGKGRGLFASRQFVKGVPIYAFDYWSEQDMPMHATNHSCNPNGSFDDVGMLIALRDIEQDEEITYHYLHHPVPASPWNFQCLCRADECVGWINVVA
jgi:SET domain